MHHSPTYLSLKAFHVGILKKHINSNFFIKIINIFFQVEAFDFLNYNIYIILV
jgi:hypothetical protein